MSKKEIRIPSIRLLLIILVSSFAFLVSYFVIKADDTNYIFSKNEDAIYRTLIDNGYSEAGACGILGNISVENPRFEPDLEANRGNTYGLFQWTDVGNRRANLKRWCNNRLLYPNRVDGQLAFAMHELGGGDSQASRVNDYLKTADNAALAAMEFCVGFERCVGATADPDADGIYTGSIYPEFYGRVYQALTKRMQNANKYYDGYAGQEIAEESVQLKPIPTAGIVAEREDKMHEELLTNVKVIEATNTMYLWLYRVISLIIGYCFGCILGVGVVVRSARKKAALHLDKKLPGPVAILRHVGLLPCILAEIIDIGKLYLALLIVYYITNGALGSEQILLVGFGVILGNDYPFWNKFRGGMGITVTALLICTYMPIWGYICCLFGLIVAIAAKSLPIGGIFISIFAIPYAFFLRGPEAGIIITMAVLLLLHKHYRFLKRYVDENMLHNHYRRGRRKKHSQTVPKAA